MITIRQSELRTFDGGARRSAHWGLAPRRAVPICTGVHLKLWQRQLLQRVSCTHRGLFGAIVKAATRRRVRWQGGCGWMVEVANESCFQA